MGLKEQAKKLKAKRLLRVASPKTCNMQQNGKMGGIGATGHATPLQQAPLKANQYKANSCNTARNTPATTAKKPCNKPASKSLRLVAWNEAETTPRAAVVWRVQVDEKIMTVIDFENRNDAAMYQLMQNTFGSSKVKALSSTWRSGGH